jgi:hypothetical protein
MRLYGPKAEALIGRWNPPPIETHSKGKTRRFPHHAPALRAGLLCQHADAHGTESFDPSRPLDIRHNISARRQ